MKSWPSSPTAQNRSSIDGAAWGDLRGVAPAPGQCPGPNSGSNKLYLSYSFPVELEETCGASPHTPAGTLSLHPFSGTGNLYVASNVPVKQSNMHTYFCRERMCFCELAAALLHAETLLQKEHCDFASWMPALRATGWAVEHRQPDAAHSGKTKEISRERKQAFSTGFFFVFIAPVGSRSGSPSYMRKNVCR